MGVDSDPSAVVDAWGKVRGVGWNARPCTGPTMTWRPQAYVEHFRYLSNRYRIAALQRAAEFPSRQSSGYVVTVRFENMEGTWPS